MLTCYQTRQASASPQPCSSSSPRRLDSNLFSSPDSMNRLSIDENEEEGSEEEETLARNIHQSVAEAALASLEEDYGTHSIGTSSITSKGKRRGQGKKSNPLISPTEKCRVCFEPAAKHIHYGSVTCFSCRAFFRRSIQDKAAAKIYKCKKQGKCDVGGLKSRKSCQKCRFDRCLEAGMKPSWVLSEDEKNRRFRKTKEKKENNNSRRRQTEDDINTESGSLTQQELPKEEEDYDDDEDMTTRSPLSPSSSRIPPLISVNIVAKYQDMPGPSHMSSNLEPLTSRIATSPLSQPGCSSTNPYPPQISRGHPSHQMAALVPRSMSPQYPYSYRSSRGVSGCMDHSLVQMGYSGPSHQQQDYPSDSESGSHHSSPGVRESFLMEPSVQMTSDEHIQIQRLCEEHDVSYKSVPFGEELIKEMVICSVFGIPLSTSAAMTGYRLMIQRITKVAQAFDPFLDLNHSSQSALLKMNADLLVSLRGAVFFEDKKKGLDQILYSMGVDDVEIGKKLLTTALQNVGEMNRIDYRNFNSLQKIESGTEKESRYEKLLARVGSTVAARPEYVKILSYIILFSSDFAELGGMRPLVENIQYNFINMLRRLIYSSHRDEVAVVVFSNLLATIADLHELTHIKKQRALAPAKAPNQN